MTTPTERGIAAALTHVTDRTDEETAKRIATELYDFGQRAWALRARLVDLRDIEATFTVSPAMLDLLRRYGLDLGAGPAGMFERAPSPDKDADLLFGIEIYSDKVGGDRHRDITLVLTDKGSEH